MGSISDDAVARPGFLVRAGHWAFARILIEGAVVVLLIIFGSQLLTVFVPPVPSPLHAEFAMLRNLVVAVLLLGAYALMVRWLERRNASELNLRKGALQLPAGAIVGLTLMASTYLVLWAMGLAHFAPGTGFDGVAIGAATALLAAVFEELLLRAVLFRNLENAFGTGIALLASAAIFGILHALNPGATLFTDAAIAIEAGILLALAYALTRNLWFAIGIHAGWNFAEGNIFGAAVSGNAMSHSVIHATLNGAPLLTGGAFGPEASIVAIGVCVTASLIIFVMTIRRAQWRPVSFRLSIP